MAKANFEREMHKVKSYFRKLGVFVLIYTDSDLADPASVFADMKRFLVSADVPAQLRLNTLEDFLSFELKQHQ